MRRHFIVLLVALIASACGSGSSEISVDDAAVVLDDATSPAMNADAPTVENEDIAAFFARFKSTVRANDAEAVANMAEFPFELGGMTREQFLDDYYASTFGEGDFRERLLRCATRAMGASPSRRSLRGIAAIWQRSSIANPPPSSTSAGTPRANGASWI